MAHIVNVLKDYVPCHFRGFVFLLMDSKTLFKDFGSFFLLFQRVCEILEYLEEDLSSDFKVNTIGLALRLFLKF